MSETSTGDVLDDVIAAIDNGLDLTDRSDEARGRLRKMLSWYASDAARAPRKVEITLVGTLDRDDFDDAYLRLPSGEDISLSEVNLDAEGVRVRDLD